MSEMVEVKRKRSEQRERQHAVRVRLNDAERVTLEEKASSTSLSLSAYMRTCALGKPGPRAKRSPMLNQEIASDAIAALNKAGSNLNQIARAINENRAPPAPEITEAADAVRQAALSILNAFGFQKR